MFYFTPLPGFFSPFLHSTMRYRSLSSIQPYGVVPACSHKVSRVSWYSGSCYVTFRFVYGAFTLSGWSFQDHSTTVGKSILQSKPQSARTLVQAPSISLAATLEIEFSFFSSGYLDVSVHRVPSVTLCIHATVTEGFSAGFPHSDIYGSMDICSSPQLFAAYRVLHRLLVPRHPPYALISLTFMMKKIRLFFHPFILIALRTRFRLLLDLFLFLKSFDFVFHCIMMSLIIPSDVFLSFFKLVPLCLRLRAYKKLPPCL